ncbi:hypothetical protein CQA75_08740, partial [Campylobacter taeniopygiae]
MNVVILGSSHCTINGITAGFREIGWNASCLSIGGSSTTFILHRIKDTRKSELFKKADLIICESNSDDYKLDLKLSCQDIKSAYEQLYLLEKKIIILLFHHHQIRQRNQITDNMHIYLAQYYGFNLIDLRNTERKLFYFFTYDNAHLYSFIPKKLGENIAKNFNHFKYPKKNKMLNQKKYFTVCHIDEMILKGNIKDELIENYINDDIVTVLKLDKQEIFFPQKYYGYYIYSVFSHNLNRFFFSALTIGNEKSFFNSLLAPCYGVKRFGTLLQINQNTKIKSNSKLDGEMDKKVQPCEKPKINKNLNYVGLISFLLVKDYHNEDIDFESLVEENIEIDKEYNFNHLIPPIEW